VRSWKSWSELIDAAELPTKSVPICRILHAHGTEGEVLVEPYLNDLTCYERLEHLRFTPVDGACRRLRIVRVRRAGERLLMQFDGVSSIAEARLLAGCEGYTQRSELPAPGEGEFYWFDLEGLAVRTEGGDCLGRVEEFFHTGSNAVLVVRQASRETLLPFIKDVILKVDDAEGTLHIRAIPGLL
jgi:16S rRNA processing protein RimM